METLRTETREGVRSIVLCRPEAYNTITPALRDELSSAIDAADADRDVHVILLRADGPAFCAGYGLDWSITAQSDERQPSAPPQGGEAAAQRAAGERSPEDLSAGERSPEDLSAGERSPEDLSAGERSPEDLSAGERSSKAWDSVSDMRMIGSFVDTYMKLWYARKPTIAAVQGWCIGGGTDMVLCADLIVAGEGASFGYPPSRVWGTPTTAMWVYRMGLERAKRYLLTGDEIPAREAAEIGMILEAVPDDALQQRAMALATRMARLPTNQLVMLKLLCNQTVENMGLASSRTLGTLFDGIARHTQEGLDFVARSQEVGFRQAVRERDDPFQDYGSRPRK
jgi:enoyl-CoA hydratase